MIPLDFDSLRQTMVSEQIERRGICDARVLAAFRAVPRHPFVPPDYRDLAYEDGPLPIGNGQTISQPYIVALMTSLLHLEGSETVLEIGTGSGYQAAILGSLCRQVYSIERHAALSHAADEVLASLGLTNIHLRVGDGSLGWEEAAPFQGILVTAAAPQAPPLLLEQLAEGGRMVIPIGGRAVQELVIWQRQGSQFTREHILSVVFVPLRGRHGWSDVEWSEDYNGAHY